MKGHEVEWREGRNREDRGETKEALGSFPRQSPSSCPFCASARLDDVQFNSLPVVRVGTQPTPLQYHVR